jgi:hypothetical protein
LYVLYAFNNSRLPAKRQATARERADPPKSALKERPNNLTLATCRLCGLGRRIPRQRAGHSHNRRGRDRPLAGSRLGERERRWFAAAEGAGPYLMRSNMLT